MQCNTLDGAPAPCMYIFSAAFEAGYKWAKKRSTPLYSTDVQKARLDLSSEIVDMSNAEFRKKLSLSMNGVVITMPPSDPTDRANFVRHGDDFEWRKPGQKHDAHSLGTDDYPHQAPLSRVVPLWAGISEGGVAPIIFHKKRKLNKIEWTKAVHAGKLTNAIKALSPVKTNGPWHVLTDNESFLHAGISQKEHRLAKVKMWFIPPKSPDLNPIERFWSWLRRQLRQMDLNDQCAKRPVLSKPQYIARVRALLKTEKAKLAASHIARGQKKICQIIVDRKGAHSGK